MLGTFDDNTMEELFESCPELPELNTVEESVPMDLGLDELQMTQQDTPVLEEVNTSANTGTDEKNALTIMETETEAKVSDVEVHQNPQHETQMVMADAASMAQSMPLPSFASFNLDSNFQHALMAACQGVTASNAVLLAGVKRGFCNMLDKALTNTRDELRRDLSYAVASTHKAFRRELASTEEKITTTIHHEVNMAQKAVDHRFNGVNNQLQELNRKIDTQDNVYRAWENPDNIHLRQVVSWILYMGLDTTCKMGMCPLIRFSFMPGRPETEDNHITILPKALLRMLVIHANKFRTKVATGLQTRIENRIMAVFECLGGFSLAQIRKFGSSFPVTLYNTGGVYVFKTKKLVRMLQEELKKTREDQGELNTSENFKIVSTVGDNGEFDIDSGLPPNRKKNLNRFRKFLGMGIPELYKFSLEFVTSRSRKDPKLKNIIAFLGDRRYWGMPASREYLSTPSFYVGVSMVLRDVFQKVVRPYDPSKPFHVGINWEVYYRSPVLGIVELLAQRKSVTPETYFESFKLHVKEANENEDEESDSDILSEQDNASDISETKVSARRRRRNSRRRHKNKRKRKSGKSPATSSSVAAAAATSGQDKTNTVLPTLDTLPDLPLPGSTPLPTVIQEEPPAKRARVGPKSSSRRRTRTTEIPAEDD